VTAYQRLAAGDFPADPSEAAYDALVMGWAPAANPVRGPHRIVSGVGHMKI